MSKSNKLLQKPSSRKKKKAEKNKRHRPMPNLLLFCCLVLFCLLYAAYTLIERRYQSGPDTKKAPFLVGESEPLDLFFFNSLLISTCLRFIILLAYKLLIKDQIRLLCFLSKSRIDYVMMMIIRCSF